MALAAGSGGGGRDPDVVDGSGVPEGPGANTARGEQRASLLRAEFEFRAARGGGWAASPDRAWERREKISIPPFQPHRADSGAARTVPGTATHVTGIPSRSALNDIVTHACVIGSSSCLECLWDLPGNVLATPESDPMWLV